MKSKNYDEFVGKFKPKLTTDDCYTPENVKDIIAEYVENHYNIPRDKHFDPFRPGGDYENEDYTGKTVVGNPPFSIITPIVRFYMQHGIPFFIYAPTLTILAISPEQPTARIISGCNIVYDNGAKVNTSFITNLEPNCVRSDPELYNAITINKAKAKRTYQDNVFNASYFCKASKRGENVKFSDFEVIRESTDKETGEDFRIYGYAIKV